jgi:signal transduction histidine kinase
MTPLDYESAWLHAPWGMAGIAADGRVCALNPAFAACSGAAGEKLLGMSEADLRARLDTLPLERHRVETAGTLRAIHYIRLITRQRMDQEWLTHLAETLREPLASIYGFAELLMSQDYDYPTRRDLTTTMLEQMELMTSLINERLDTSKPLLTWPARGALDRKPLETT